MNKITRLAFAGLLSSVLVLPLLVVATNGTYPVPTGEPITLEDIQGVIRQIADFMIYIGIAVAVIFIIWGGITYMLAGGDDTKIATAKKRIIYGIIGAAIIIGVGAIIRTLQYILYSPTHML